MRIVLDTNVVVSAVLWHGTPYRLLEAIRRHPGAQLFSSAVLLEELAEVLTRPLATKRLALIRRSAQDVLADYIDALDIVTPLSPPPAISADPDDDHVIAAAVVARADILISGDGDLLALVEHQGIRILAPAAAIPLLAAG